jgi:hypothetical protein
MKGESGETEKSVFTKIQKFAEIIIFAVWILAIVLLILDGSEFFRLSMEILSIALLGVGLFNVCMMVGFSAAKRSHFQFGLFFIRIAYILLSAASLAISLFVAGIRIR